MNSVIDDDKYFGGRYAEGGEEFQWGWGIHDTPLSRMVREARRKGKRLCSSGGGVGFPGRRTSKGRS